MKTTNARGFTGYCDFIDTYQGRVRVHESSAASGDRVWVTIDSAMDVLLPPEMNRRLYLVGSKMTPMALTPVEAQAAGLQAPALKAATSAHLSREQARVLRDALDEFLQDQIAKDHQG